MVSYKNMEQELEILLKTKARKYVEDRFPHASVAEKNKIINDWGMKVKNARLLVDDFRLRVRNPAGLRVLDAGSGMGGNAIAFAEAGAVVDGVDIEKELIDIAGEISSSWGKFPIFTLYDGNKLPFAENTFDVAFSVSVLEHVTDPVNFLKEINRVLKPGAIFYLAFPNRLWPKETHTGLWCVTYLPIFIARAVVRFFNKNPLEENNLHFYTYMDLCKMLKLSGGWILCPEKGKSNNFFKKIVRRILSFTPLPYKAFLPHISVLLKKQ